MPNLNERYGEAYEESDVEQGEYPGVAPVKTIAVPNLLMVREDMDETLAHDLINLMFDNQQQLVDVHPSAEKLTLEDAQKVVEGVELHPGAERATTARRRSEARRGALSRGRRGRRGARLRRRGRPAGRGPRRGRRHRRRGRPAG